MSKSVVKVAELVKTLLTRNPSARDNDMLLYEYVMNYYNISVKTSFDEVKRLIEQKKLPTLWSVERARRKVQEMCENLRPSDYAKRLKEELKDDYIELSRYNQIANRGA